MAIRFIVGPPGSGKTHWCMEKTRELSREDPFGPPALMLVLQQASYQMEASMLEGDVRGTTRVRVVSYGRLSNWVWTESPAPDLPRLSDVQRRVLVTLALARLRANSDEDGLVRIGNIDASVMSLLNETKSARLSADDLARASAHLEPTRPGLSRKLRDLATILREYQQLVRDHFEDPEEALASLGQTIETFAPLQGARLFVDTYSGVAPAELEVLRGLAVRCAEINITLDMDADRYGALMHGNAKPDPFSRFFRTEEMLAHLRGMAADNSFQILEPVILPDKVKATTPARFTNARAIAHVAKNFLRRKERIESGADDLVMEIALTPRDEAKRAMEHLLDWKRERGWQWKDMAIVTRNLGSYGLLLEEELRAARVPFFLDRREPLETHPLVQGTLAAIEIATGGFRTWAVMDFARSGLYRFDADAVARLQAYVSAYPPPPDRWTQTKEWHAPPRRDAFEDAPDDAAKDETNPHDAFRRELVAPLQTLKNDFDQSRDEENTYLVLDVVRALCSFVRHAGTMEEGEDEDVLRQWAGLMHEIVEAAGNERLGKDALADLFKELLTGLTLPRIPPVADQVIVGQADRSRFPALKGVVVVGLAEGTFPAPVANATLLTDSERDTLEQCMADVNWKHALEPSSRKAFQSEAYFALLALTRASEQLVLLRPSADSNGKELAASPYWEEILSLMPEDMAPRRIVHPLRPERVRLPAEAAAVLVRDILRGGEVRDEEFAPSVRLPIPTLKLSERDARTFDDVLRHAGRRNVARLDEGLARELLGKELVTSASSLRDFASCPFKHFLRKMIRAQVPDKVSISAADLGNLAHATLKSIGEELARERKGFDSLAESSISDTVDRAFARPLERLQEAGIFQRPHEVHAATTLREALKQLVQHMARFAKHVANRPVALEKNFATQGEDLVVPPVKVSLGDGHTFTVRLRGQIDRVDVFRSGDTDWLMVFDYKSSDQRMKWNEARMGLDLQLSIYLWVLSKNTGVLTGNKKTRLAGAFFQRMHGGKGKTSEEADFRPRGVLTASALDVIDPQTAKDNKLFSLGSAKTSANEATMKSGDVIGDRQMDRLVGEVARHIEQHARGIASGQVGVEPVGGAAFSPCNFCDFALACRVDYGMNSPRMVAPMKREFAVESWLGPPCDPEEHESGDEE